MNSFTHRGGYNLSQTAGIGKIVFGEHFDRVTRDEQNSKFNIWVKHTIDTDSYEYFKESIETKCNGDVIVKIMPQI